MSSDATNPEILVQMVTRSECAANTRRMFGVVNDLKESVGAVADRVDRSTDRIEIIAADMVAVATKQKEDRAYRRGQEEGARKTAQSAVSIRGWILGALTAGGAIASAVWFIAGHGG